MKGSTFHIRAIHLIRAAIDRMTPFLSFLFYYPYVMRQRFFRAHIPRLHVGCGRNHFSGWINADITPSADLIVFLQRRLPFPDASLNRIYSEHVLEHVSYENGVFFLRQAYRVLNKGGIIRIAMPDLDDLIDGYQQNWRRFDWVNWPDFSFLHTRAQMINVAFRWWGHQHLYNREELIRALTEAGFSRFQFVDWGKSTYEDLRGLETRIDSRLIVEAVKE